MVSAACQSGRANIPRSRDTKNAIPIPFAQRFHEESHQGLGRSLGIPRNPVSYGARPADVSSMRHVAGLRNSRWLGPCETVSDPRLSMKLRIAKASSQWRESRHSEYRRLAPSQRDADRLLSLHSWSPWFSRRNYCRKAVESSREWSQKHVLVFLATSRRSSNLSKHLATSCSVPAQGHWP